MQLDIANPEIWKSEFRYSEIAFFVLDYVSISIGILVKALPHLRCVAAFMIISRLQRHRYAVELHLFALGIRSLFWAM